MTNKEVSKQKKNVNAGVVAATADADTNKNNKLAPVNGQRLRLHFPRLHAEGLSHQKFRFRLQHILSEARGDRYWDGDFERELKMDMPRIDASSDCPGRFRRLKCKV